MKKLLAIVSVVLTFYVPTALRADEGLYIGAQGGVNLLRSKTLEDSHITFDTGYNVGVVGGYAFCNGLRFDAEITYRHNDYRLLGVDEESVETAFHGDVYTWSFMGNGYYNIPLPSAWCLAPYLGAGIGWDKVHQSIKIEDEHFKGCKAGFAWHLMAGADYSLCEDIVLALEYKFHVSQLRYGNHLHDHSITICVKKFFDCSF